MQRFIQGALIAGAVAFGSLSFGAQAADYDVSNTVLKVGCETAFPPFTYIDETGALIGFDLDLIRVMAKSVGYKDVEICPMPFDGLIPAIITGSIDVIISGFTISEERAKKVDFSDPYYLCGLTYLTRPEDAEKYAEVSSLADKTLCVQMATAGGVYVSKTLPDATLKQFNSPPETYIELANKGCEATINDKPVNDFFLNSAKNTSGLVSHRLTTEDKEYYGIAVGKQNPHILKLMNEGLKQVMENGEFKRVSEQWFGYDISDDLKN